MKSLLDSEDRSAAMTAGLILGRHYVRNGQLEEGYELLKGNLNDSYLDRFTKVSGHLWVFDAAEKSGDTDRVNEELGYLNNVDMDEKAEKAFRHYCAQEQRPIIDDVRSCVTAKAGPGESEVIIEIFDEPKLVIPSHEDPAPPIMEKIVVNVKSAEADPQLVEAMLYSVGKMGVDVELDLTGEKEEYDFILDVSTKTVTGLGGVYEFDIDMARVFDETINLAMLNGGMNLVLGYTPELIEKALEIEEKYKYSDIKIYKFDITDPGFQSTLKTIKEQAGENTTISFAVAGTEKQLVKIVPFLRFYSDKPDKSIIACGVNGFGKLFFNQEYIGYFRGAYVVSEVLLLGNKEVERFNEDYYSDYEKLPTVKDMMGHDMIVFMEKVMNPAILNEYLTGIKSLEDSRTVREAEAYQIVSSNKVKKLIN